MLWHNSCIRLHNIVGVPNKVATECKCNHKRVYEEAIQKRDRYLAIIFVFKQVKSMANSVMLGIQGKGDALKLFSKCVH